MVANRNCTHCSRFTGILSLNVLLFHVVIITNQTNAGRLTAGNALAVGQRRLQHRRTNHGNVLEKGKVHATTHAKFVIFLKSTFILITCAAYYAA